MANRKRPIVLRCPVTAEERALIEQKMAQLPTQRIGAYLRKMAIDGYIIYTDTADIKAFTKELSAIDRNINQIAKRINAGGPAYQADMDEIRERLDEISRCAASVSADKHNIVPFAVLVNIPGKKKSLNKRFVETSAFTKILNCSVDCAVV